VNAEILTIGTEIVLGFIVDTNGPEIARALAGIGLRVARTGSVPDDHDAIRSAIGAALDRVSVVVCSGGLGPTGDDVTRAAAAEVFGRRLVRDEKIVEALRARFAERGINPMPASNLVQADVPEGAEVIPNPLGTAPGLWLQDGGKILVLMPGVPKELRRILVEEAVPRLMSRVPARPHAGAIKSRTLRTAGIGESALHDKLGDLKPLLGERITLAWLPSVAGTDLRLTVWDVAEPDADAMLARAAEALRQKLGPRFYGEDDEDLAAVVLKQLAAERAKISVAESCTGGLLAQRLTAIPGCSSWFFGGVVAYDNELKLDFLGVSAETISQQGAVSEAVARQMAEGAARVMRTEAAIGVTGIAGPDGGTPAKPVGTVWIGIRWRDTTRAFHHVFPGDREDVRGRAAQWSLDYLRRVIAGTV